MPNVESVCNECYFIYVKQARTCVQVIAWKLDRVLLDLTSFCASAAELANALLDGPYVYIKDN